MIAVLAACTNLSTALATLAQGQTPTPTSTSQPAAQGDQSNTVSLQFANGAGGVLLFVPVTIHGQGPYDFVLDTGASRTVVDRQLAEQLGLSAVPGIVQGSNVTGSVQASIVKLKDWRIGDIDAPEVLAANVDLQQPDAGPLREFVGDRMHGLLGSDTLSTFGAVTIDYANGQLHLGPQ
jgi:predicted aspartyl protease